jgi:hypothetical protein
MSELEEIEDAFRFHPPKSDETVAAHNQTREMCLALAVFFFNTLPKSAERTEAIKRVREAMHWANSAIAIHGTNNEGV